MEKNQIIQLLKFCTSKEVGTKEQSAIKSAHLKVLKEEIEKELENLPCFQKQSLHYFYIEAKKWEKVASILHYSVPQCKRFRNQGLESLCKSFENNTKIMDVVEHLYK